MLKPEIPVCHIVSVTTTNKAGALSVELRAFPQFAGVGVTWPRTLTVV